MKKIYILLSKTDTLPSRMIHFSLGGKFTHTSISLTPSTDKFYSFARRSLNNPLNAGFLIENTHTFVFSKYPNCSCAVYSLDVSDDAYERMQKIISYFVDNRKKFDYNFLGLLPARLGIKLHRKYHFTCSQFVATVLYRSGAAELPKDPSLMMPNDFIQIEGITQIYSGCISNCYIPTPCYSENNI